MISICSFEMKASYLKFLHLIPVAQVVLSIQFFSVQQSVAANFFTLFKKYLLLILVQFKAI